MTTSVYILELFFLVPPRAICSEFNNHERKSIGSPDIEQVYIKHKLNYQLKHKPCSVILNLFLEVEATAWSISCGLT